MVEFGEGTRLSQHPLRLRLVHPALGPEGYNLDGVVITIETVAGDEHVPHRSLPELAEEDELVGEA